MPPLRTRPAKLTHLANIRSALAGIFRRAVLGGLLARNPADGILGRMGREDREVRQAEWLTEPELTPSWLRRSSPPLLLHPVHHRQHRPCIGITFDVYGHLAPDATREAAETWEAILTAPGRNPGATPGTEAG